MNTVNTLTAFAPIVGNQPRLLVLGSMPGVASLDANCYYAHPRNAFWSIIETVFATSLENYQEKTALLEARGVALWDVLKHCEREGSLDSNIRSGSAVCNDFGAFFRQYPSIDTVAFNGKTAEKLFRKRVLAGLENHARLTLLSMPSTSPAMASLNLGEKTLLWAKAFAALQLEDC